MHGPLPVGARAAAQDGGEQLLHRRGVPGVEGDVAGMLDGLDGADQATVFTGLTYMNGTKIGALKTRAGIG